MVLKSHAKINLTLSVNKKLKNGLHDIQTLFCLINLFDKISIKKQKNKKKDKISFKGPYSKHVNKSKNSVRKILTIMRETKLISDYYSVVIYKKIPVFAGLGGGTSNAATVLKSLFKKKIKTQIFDKIVNYVGSDLRLFFYNQGILKNLKTVENLDKKYKLYFLLAYPNIRCSTKKIYSQVNKYSKNKFFFKKFQRKEAFNHFIDKTKNDLQSIVEKNYPLIRTLIKDIKKEKGCYLSKMTGSGSACYGLFINESCSKVALYSLKKKYPNFWFSIAKTI